MTTRMPQFNSFQNGTFSQHAGGDDQITQDMYLKMCKKIAQLTKVIFALNTKNDEYENVIDGLKDSHRKELENYISESTHKLEHYKVSLEKLNRGSEEVQKLEKMLQECEKERSKAYKDFENYKKEAEAKIVKLKDSHASKLANVATEVLDIKQTFQSKLQMTEEILNNYREQNNSNVEQLERKYKAAMENQLKENKSKIGTEENKRNEVEVELKKLLGESQTRVERLTLEIARLSDEHQENSKESAKQYESALQILKDKITSMEKNFDEQLKQYKNALESSSSTSNKEQQKLLEQLSDNQQKLRRQQIEIDEQQEVARINADQIDKLRDEVLELNAEKVDLSGVVDRLSNDRDQLVRTCASQADEIVSKSNFLNKAELTKLQLESERTGLNNQISRLQEELKTVLSSLDRQHASADERSRGKDKTIVALQQTVDNLKADRTEMKARFESDMELLRQKMDEALLEQSNRWKAEKEDLLAQHRAELNKVEELKDASLKDVETRYESIISTMKIDFKSQREDIEIQHQSALNLLTEQLDHAKAEVERLNALVSSGLANLQSTSDIGQRLKEEADSLKAKLDMETRQRKYTQDELRKLQEEKKSLEEEILSLKNSHSAELESEKKLLRLELERLWQAKLDSACERIKEAADKQKDLEIKMEAAKVALSKDQQQAELKMEWDRQTHTLQLQIQELHMSLSKNGDQHGVELDELRRQLQIQAERHTVTLQQAESNYNNELKELRVKFEVDLKDAEDEAKSAQVAAQESLRQSHHNDIQHMERDHMNEIKRLHDELQEQAEEQLKALTERLEKEHENRLSEVERRAAQDLEQTKRQYQQEQAAAKMEIDRALQLLKQKEGVFAMEREELQDTVKYREQALVREEQNTKELQMASKVLKDNLEKALADIEALKQASREELRQMEQRLQHKYASHLQQRESDFESEKQDLLEQFNDTQEILKDKIAGMERMLEEAENRYKNRESREDDLQRIAQLRELVTERDVMIKRMEEEKRYFQMELVNRETNFNKVFNANPNVGVLDPRAALTKPKKTGSGGKRQGKNSPSVVGRLPHLPGSPLHDERFNKAEPLPPTHRK